MESISGDHPRDATVSELRGRADARKCSLGELLEVGGWARSLDFTVSEAQGKGLF